MGPNHVVAESAGPQFQHSPLQLASRATLVQQSSEGAEEEETGRSDEEEEAHHFVDPEVARREARMRARREMEAAIELEEAASTCKSPDVRI